MKTTTQLTTSIPDDSIVEQIERLYLRFLPPSKKMAENLASRGANTKF